MILAVGAPSNQPTLLAILARSIGTDRPPRARREQPMPTPSYHMHPQPPLNMAMNQPRHGSPFERESPSPVPQPQMTKRDVRRNRMVEKLQQMMDSFNSNQHQHYRAQLQAVQVDMNLILRADPYEGIPLEDGGDEIRSLVEGMGANMPADDAAQRDYWAMAGNRYRTFVREANDAIEQRDADLTALHVSSLLVDYLID